MNRHRWEPWPLPTEGASLVWQLARQLIRDPERNPGGSAHTLLKNPETIPPFMRDWIEFGSRRAMQIEREGAISHSNAGCAPLRATVTA